MSVVVRCSRCGSVDLAVTDASNHEGFRIICYSCGLIWHTPDLEETRR